MPGSFGEAATFGTGHQRSADIDARVGAAIAASQTFLVVRILSVLLGVSMLPVRLPAVELRLDATHAVVLPFAGFNRGAVLLVVVLVSALELYLVYRLADRVPMARFTVLLIESLAIVLTTIALAMGAGFALLPLVTAVGATCLLLLNQVRWAFRLRPQRRALTGYRQGGTFAGYAAPSLDVPKAPQPIGYVAQQAGSPRGGATPLPAPPRRDMATPARPAGGSSGYPLGWSDRRF